MKKLKPLFIIFLLSLFMITKNINSQEVSPGVLISDDNSLEKADESAILDVNSETKGFLPPRLNIKQRDAIEDPAEGLTIFNTTTKKLNYFDGINWIELGESGDSKSTTVDSKNTEKDAKVACEANITVNNNNGTIIPICDGGVLLLTTPEVEGTNVTYRWSGPDGWTSSLRTCGRANITPNMDGLYKVVVSVNGTVCVARDSVQVTINKSPSIDASNTGPYCEGETITLNATSRHSRLFYSWSGPGGWTSTSSSPTRSLATTSMSGTYTITVMNMDGCTASAQTNVVVNPGFTSSQMPDITVCEGDAIKLCNNATIVRGYTYSWTGPNNFYSEEPCPEIPNSNTTMSGYYNVTITNSFGCTGERTVNVTVYPKPSVIISANVGTCEGGTVSLSVPTTTNATYRWTGPNNFSSSSRTISRTNATSSMAGIYYVTVTSAEGCSRTNQRNINVTPKPAVSATNTGPYCTGNTISLSATNNSDWTYSWSGPNGWTSTSQSPTISNATAFKAGTYTVTVYSPLGGCTNSASTNVIVNITPVSPSAGNHTNNATQITWRWNSVNGATGYKWSTTNDYSTAVDKGPYSYHTETGLTCGTSYTRYAWAYNNCGYSAAPLVITFTTAPCPSCTGEKVFDVDGNLYLAVQIGEQCWLDRNLKTTKYKNGTSIPTTQYRRVYSTGNTTDLSNIYGLHYSGTIALENNICPTGWHVATADEWQTLINYADNLTGVPYGQEAGKVLKDTRCGSHLDHPRWRNCPPSGINNSTGFGALASGCYYTSESAAGSKGWYWTSSVNSVDGRPIARFFYSENNVVYQDRYYPNFQMAVRCIKD